MNVKSLLVAAIVALGATSFADTASAGERHHRGGSSHGNYSHGNYSRGYSHHQHRGYTSNRGYSHYGYAPRYYNDRCYSGYSGYSGYSAYSGYYGPRISVRVGPLVFRSGSSRGYCRY